MLKMNAKQLRSQSTGYSLQSTAKKEIYIILDNVLDTYNIGAVFRLADAVNAKKVYLCGAAETPPNPRIKKASINTTEILEWEYCESATEAIRKLKEKFSTNRSNKNPLSSSSEHSESRSTNIQVVAIEQNAKSIPYNKYQYKLPLALVVGNESYGILPETLKLCDGVVELPMFGVNISLNVMVSLAIVLYQAIGENE